MVDCCILNIQKDTNKAVSLLVWPISLGWRTFERWKSRGPYNTACIHRILHLFFYLRRRRCRQSTMHVYERTASIAMNMIQSNKMQTDWMCTMRRSYDTVRNVRSTVVGQIWSYILTSFLGMHSIVYMVDCCVNIWNDPDTSCILFGLIEPNESRRMEESIWHTYHIHSYPYLFDYVGVVAVN